MYRDPDDPTVPDEKSMPGSVGQDLINEIRSELCSCATEFSPKHIFTVPNLEEIAKLLPFLKRGFSPTP